jgi:hypothetical protein
MRRLEIMLSDTPLGDSLTSRHIALLLLIGLIAIAWWPVWYETPWLVASCWNYFPPVRETNGMHVFHKITVGKKAIDPKVSLVAVNG